MKDEALLARLAEDLASAEEAEQLLPTARRLEAWQAPLPSAADTARLIAKLKPQLPTPDPQSPIPNLLASWAWLLVRSQFRVVRGEIWAASALVMTLGLAVTMLTAASSANTLPFVLVAPLVAAVGIAFLYGPSADPALEIELATPASPRLVLLARLVLVFGFDLALGLAASAALALARADLSFWPLVWTWLAPMAFLSALAFLLTVLSPEPTLGTLVSLSLWGLLNAISLAHQGHYAFLDALPDLLANDARTWMWALAGVLGVAALWLGGREEHWVSKLT